jgi:hypothetical protein
MQLFNIVESLLSTGANQHATRSSRFPVAARRRLGGAIAAVARHLMAAAVGVPSRVPTAVRPSAHATALRAAGYGMLVQDTASAIAFGLADRPSRTRRRRRRRGPRGARVGVLPVRRLHVARILHVGASVRCGCLLCLTRAARQKLVRRRRAVLSSLSKPAEKETLLLAYLTRSRSQCP